MKIRIKFSKHGCMKFIGHLDVMRYFQKANIRANVDIAYSEGFNPHQIMSFAAPLGVGITSDGEYYDIQVNSTRKSKEMIEALNKAMVPGMKVLEYKKLPDDAKKSMSLVALADYYVYPKNKEDISQYSGKVTEFINQNEIMVTKKTKKSEATIDIKEHILELDIKKYTSIDEDVDDIYAYFIKVHTGSENNIKPELVLKAFYEYIGVDFSEEEFQIHRNETYALINNQYVSLGSMGEDIE